MWHRSFLYPCLTGASQEYLPYLWLDHGITASCKNKPSWPTEKALSENQNALRRSMCGRVRSSFSQYGRELQLSTLCKNKRCVVPAYSGRNTLFIKSQMHSAVLWPCDAHLSWLLLICVRLERCREVRTAYECRRNQQVTFFDSQQLCYLFRFLNRD